MAFTLDEIFNGILAIIWVSTSVVVGITIASRYRKYKQNSLLFVGICWTAIAQAWWGACVSFIIGLFNDGVGLLATPQIYFILGTPGNAILFPLWVWVIVGLLKKDKQKLITSVYIIINVLYLIYFFIFVWSTAIPHPIAELQSPVDVKYNGLSFLFMMYIMGSLVASGIFFSRKLLLSDSLENRLKGKFLLICFISLGIGAVSDSIITPSVVTLFITRGILILSAITMYFGWLLPEKVKNKLIK